MSAKQLSVFLENAPGSLADFCAVLEKNDINMRAMCLAESQDFGLLRFVTDDAEAANAVLKKEGFICAVSEIIAVEIEDKAGSLTKILSVIGNAGINLEYSYAFLSKNADKAYSVLKVSDAEAGEKVLCESGIRTIEQEEFEKLF
ncbi:MAG: acetolactate synthase [Lachnospiraceae bacterium]|jgi:hypothetical protein